MIRQVHADRLSCQEVKHRALILQGAVGAASGDHKARLQATSRFQRLYVLGYGSCDKGHRYHPSTVLQKASQPVAVGKSLPRLGLDALPTRADGNDDVLRPSQLCDNQATLKGLAVAQHKAVALDGLHV
jgi:hypothetical protein